MTRPVYDEKRLTPFGLWIRRTCRNSKLGLSVTNIDYEIEDFRDRDRKRIMLVEEKQYMGKLHYGQAMHFMRLDQAERLLAEREGFEYRGFFLVQLSAESPENSDLILVNGVEVSEEGLRRFINFEEDITGGLNGNRPWEWRKFVIR